jgi:hypothetical protein
MIGGVRVCLAAAICCGVALSAAAVTVTKNVDIVVTPSTGVPTITVSPTIAHGGDTVTITVTNAPNTQGTDFVDLFLQYTPNPSFYGGRIEQPNFRYVGKNQHNATFSWTVPTAPSDSDLHYVWLLLANDRFDELARTSWLTVPATIKKTPPTATAPSWPAPFTPAHTLSVCPSGCDYTLPHLAVDAAYNARWDNVLVNIRAGTYNDCTAQYGPPHLWLRGVGGDFAHFDSQAGDCAGKGIIVARGFAGHSLTVENIEVSHVTDTLSPQEAAIYVEGEDNKSVLWVRNSYIHDGNQGIISGKPGLTTIVENSHFARLGSGLTHNLYIDGDNFTFRNNISEQTGGGHELKTRAKVSTVYCNRFFEAYDEVFRGAKDVNFAEGRQAYLHDNLIAKGSHSPGDYLVGWADDREYPSDPTNFIVMKNNILLDDAATTTKYLVGFGTAWTLNLSSSLWQSSNNIFVSAPERVLFYYNRTDYHGNPISGPTIPQSGDTQYDSRAAAGFGSTQFPTLPNCTGPIGNVAIP